jgi:ATP-binding cassette subfamily B protein
VARNKYDVDEKIIGQFNFSYIKRLAAYLKPVRGLMFTTLAFVIVTSVLSMLSPMITRQAVDVSLPNKDFKSIVLLAMSLLAIYIFNAVIERFRLKAMNVAGQSLVADLRRDVFLKLQSLPFDFFDSRPHGKILVRVVNYVNSISSLMTSGLINLITDSFTVIITMVMMMLLSVKLSLIMLCGVVIFGTIIFLMKNTQRRAWQSYSSKQSNLNAYIHESIAGIKVTQAFNRERQNREIFENQCENVRLSFMRAKVIDICNWPMVETISTITTCIVFFVGGYELLYTNSLSTGTLVAFVGYVWLFWTPILSICNYYNELVNTAAYLERVFEVLDTPVLVKDRENAVEMGDVKGDVEFKNVSFEYDESSKILKDMSFKVKAGETIAIVGPTGAGKTTIINLLSRFYDIQDGEILIDGENITNFTLSSLRRNVGVMLQDTFIFSGSVYDNIRYGKLDATKEEIRAAAKAVCADEFIEELEDGYNTQVNERGSRLSTGQRQLISFARVLLSDPKIIILDEATSSIDTRTEKALQEGINKLLKNRTGFVIAHRLSTIRNADRIMYIEDGIIKESGTHDELIERKGLYYKLYTSQYEA